MIEQINYVVEHPQEARRIGRQLQKITRDYFNPEKRIKERIKAMEELVCEP